MKQIFKHLAQKLKVAAKAGNSEYTALEALPDGYQKATVEADTAAFTIVSKNYLHYALSLRNSFLVQNPQCRFVIFLMDAVGSQDDIDAMQKLTANGVEIIPFMALQDSLALNVDMVEMLTRYSVLEINTAIKPYAIEMLLNQGHKTVMYIDPDILFYSSIAALEEKLEDNDIVLTPHLLEPYNDEKAPSELDIMRSGCYNLGFIALKNTDNVYQFVRWWQNKLFTMCYSDVERGLFTDQRWIDLVPSLYDKVFIFKHPGHNVAYWNLHERNMVFDGEKWQVNGEELVFFHFSGMPLDDINSVSKHQNRHTLDALPHLKPLFEEYRDIVRQYGADRFKSLAYFFNAFVGGAVQFPDLIRKNLINDMPSFPNNPFVGDEVMRIKVTEYLKADLFGDGLVNRVSYCIWEARPDLQAAFPDLSNNAESRQNFFYWVTDTGYQPYVKDKSLLPQQEAAAPAPLSPIGINVIGYFEHILGIGETARLFYKKAQSTGLPLSIFPISSEAHASISEKELAVFQPWYAQHPAFDNSLFFVNADEIPNVKQYFPHLFKDRKVCAVWWWEFDDYFDFQAGFECVDSVIAYTDFVAEAVRKSAPEGVEVRKMTYPFIKNWEVTISPETFKEKLGIKNDEFTFMFSFDYYSGFIRKNPAAVLNAFRLLCQSESAVRLIVKTNHSSDFPEETKILMDILEESGIKDKVVFVEDALSRNEIISLINSADAYVSMHRSEGLGQGMLEAMFLGKPVIATRYGGNLDFMNEDNSLLIDYQLAEVEKDFGPYKKGWLWADPSVEHAAELMLKLVRDPAAAKRIGEVGRASAENKYNVNNFVTELFDFVTEFTRKS